MSIPFVLFAIFLTLKLCDVIAWSWVWVTSPLWISAAMLMLFLALGIGMVLIFKKKVKGHTLNLRRRFRDLSGDN